MPFPLYETLVHALPWWATTIYGVGKLTAIERVDQMQDKAHAQAQWEHTRAGAGLVGFQRPGRLRVLALESWKLPRIYCVCR